MIHSPILCWKKWFATGMLMLGCFTTLAHADKMLVLEDPVVAGQARIDLLQQAQKTVKAQYFIVGSDPLTFAGFALARDAAWRGCDVRIIIDASTNWAPKDVLCYLSTQGVQIKVYHPFRLSKLHWITRRMHDKGLSMDGGKMIRGGRNIQDSYFGRAPRNFIDRDAYAEGNVVKHSDEYFDKLWNSGEVCWFNTTRLSVRSYERGCQIIDEARLHLVMSKKWKINTGHDWGNGLHNAGQVRFLHDPVGKKDIEPGVAESLRDLIRQAHKSILIETPYFVPTPEFFRELRMARERGVKSIEVVTNSPASTDGMYVQAGYEAEKKRLLKMGVKIWEFNGPHTLHAKSLVVDGEYAVVGSFNLDPRSQHLNTETAIAARDGKTAAALTLAINAHKKASTPACEKTNYKNVALMERIKFFIYRMSLPLIWAQL